MLDLFDNIWAEKPTISLDNCVDLTSQVSHIVKIYRLLIKVRLTLEDRACCHQCRRWTLWIATGIIVIFDESPGFGRRMQFADDETIPSGHRMTFKESLHVVSLNVFQRLIFPKWAMVFTSKLRKIRIAFDELEVSLRIVLRNRLIITIVT